MDSGRSGIFEFLGAVFSVKGSGKSANTATDTEDQKYHAVVVRPSKYACHWAKALAGHRFLSVHAPPLPLEDCDAAKCECTYAHYADRRKGPRRRSEREGDGGQPRPLERREKRGRRAEDRDEDFDVGLETYLDSPSYYDYTEEHISPEDLAQAKKD